MANYCWFGCDASAAAAANHNKTNVKKMMMLPTNNNNYESTYTCPKCPEWRLKFFTLDQGLPYSLPASHCNLRYGLTKNNSPYIDHLLDNPAHMVIETQRIFRRSLPPESVLERAKVCTFSSGSEDAPKFNEIVVVTTRRGEVVSQHCNGSPLPPLKQIPSSLNPDLGPTLRKMESNEAALRALRTRVERYRSDVDDDATSRRISRKAELMSTRHLSCHSYPTSSVITTTTNSYPRSRSYVRSYDDDYISPTLRSRISTSSGHCHPGCLSSHPSSLSSSYLTPLTYMTPSTYLTRSHAVLPSTSTLPLTTASQWHFCPATRRIELGHQYQHAPLPRRSVDVDYGYTSRRSRSEHRDSDRVEAAGQSLEKLRADLRSTTNKFSKHRQLIDRYLRLDPHQRLENVEPAVIKKYDEVAERIPELLIMNYGLYRRPIDSASLWSTQITLPERRVETVRHRSIRNSTPFEARGRIRSVISRTAQSVPPI